MGVIHASVIVRNPAEPDKAWEGKFRVDTGAIDSLVPRPHLEAIGLKPKDKRLYEMADGSEVSFDATTADVGIYGTDRGSHHLVRRGRHRAPAGENGSPVGMHRDRPG